MSKICFVTEESINGIYTVITEVIKNWPNKNDKILILSNRNHWAVYNFKNKIKNAVYLNCPIYTPSDVCKILHIQNPSLIIKFFVKLLFFYYTPYAVLKIMVLLRDEKINIVFSHNGGVPGGYLPRVAIYASKISGILSALIIHNYPQNPHIRVYSFIRERLLGYCSTVIISVSKTCAKIITEKCQFNKEILLIHNGISLDQKNIKNLSEFDKSIHKRKLIFIGEISPRKGITVLLAALADLNLDFELDLYGEGDHSYLKDLKLLVSQYGLDQSVKFLGFDSKAYSYIQNYDALVLPSVGFESLPMVVLEAMRSSVPVVCTKIGGVGEMVIDNVSGYILDPGNIEQLASALKMIYGDPNGSKKMGIAGNQILREKFDIKFCALNYSKIFSTS